MAQRTKQKQSSASDNGAHKPEPRECNIADKEFSRKEHIEIELSVWERLCFHRIMPEQGSLSELIFFRDLKEATELSDQERLDFRVVQGANGLVSWDIKLEVPLILKVDPSQVVKLYSMIEAASQQKKLPNDSQMIDLFQKIEGHFKNLPEEYRKRR